MGTGFKGGSYYYRSIGQNLLIVESTYAYKNGWFGENSPHGGKSIRNISSDDNLAAAADFYNKIAYGGIERKIDDNTLVTRMADGTEITMRKVSHSDGTPAVDINIKKSRGAAGIKSQKIHFIQED